jgi:hypothetical protein
MSANIDTEPAAVSEAPDAASDTPDSRSRYSNGNGGEGGARVNAIGDAGERFVFDELASLVEAYFEREGTLLEPFGDGTDANCRGELDGETHTVTIADVSHDKMGYDLLLEGAQLEPVPDELAIAAVGDDARSLVEVKSTTGGRDAFTLSPHEYNIALVHSEQYAVVRVHQATSEPSIYRLFHDLPNLDQRVNGVTYRATGVTIEY